jgi:uncharacterized protein YndB with AHSA1/START domain/DNA-binding transcriptional ArsR family regulator
MDDDRVFRALADPTRRLLLDQLFERDGRTLTELVSLLEMTRFGVMKHLRALEEAGLVATRRAGREKLHYLNPVPIQLLSDRWIGKYAERVAALADLKAALEGDQTVASNTATRPRHLYEVFIKAPRERVWQAITTAEFTSRYFYGTHVRSQLRPGSAFDYFYEGAPSPIVEGEVIESDPPRRLVHTWHSLWGDLAKDAPSRLTWELEEAAAGMTKLRVLHEFEEESDSYREVGGGWPWVLSNLKTLLETGDTLPAPASATAS